MATTVFMAEGNGTCQAAPSGTNTTATVPNTQVQGPVFYRCALLVAQYSQPERALVEFPLRSVSQACFPRQRHGASALGQASCMITPMAGLQKV